MLEVKDSFVPIVLSLFSFGAAGCSDRQESVVEHQASNAPTVGKKPVAPKVEELPLKPLVEGDYFPRKDEYRKLVPAAISAHNALFELHMHFDKAQTDDLLPATNARAELEKFLDLYRTLASDFESRNLHPYHGAQRGEDIRLAITQVARTFQNSTTPGKENDTEASLEKLIRELRLFVECTTGKYGY